MSDKFNGLVEAIFLPPRNWVLQSKLTFTCGHLNNEHVKLLSKCGVEISDKGKGKAEITAPKGYITDLASVPRAAWAFIAPFDVARAAIIHDVLYEKINGAFKAGKIDDREPARELADNTFRHAMECSSPAVAGWKIFSAYWSVRVFGRFAIKSSAPRGAKPALVLK